MAEYSRSRTLETPGSWAVEGIGEDFIPSIADLSSVRHAYPSAMPTASTTPANC